MNQMQPKKQRKGRHLPHGAWRLQKERSQPTVTVQGREQK